MKNDFCGGALILAGECSGKEGQKQKGVSISVRRPLPVVGAPWMSERRGGCGEGFRPRPAASRGQRRLALRRGIDHQRPVRDGPDLNALLEEAAEEESPELRLPPVEAKCKLVQVGLEVVALHRALVRAQQPSFGEAGDPVHPRKEHVGLSAGLGHVDRAVDVVGPDGRGIRLQPIGHHRRAWLDVVPKERAQRDRLRVEDHPQAASAKALGVVQLHGHRDESLPRGSSAPFPGADPAEGRLVHLHDAGQPISARPHHRGAQPVEHGPHRLVGTEPEEAMERERRNAVLRRCHVPSHREPDGQRGARAVEDRPSRDRHAATAGLAPVAAILDARAALARAARAHEAAGPPQPLQVVQARVVVCEPRTQFRVAARIIATGDERGGGLLSGHHYILCLPHSNGYPLKKNHPRSGMCSGGDVLERIGGDLLSHPVARAVPSALRGLTAVFGMGTGVSPSPWPPKKSTIPYQGSKSACDAEKLSLSRSLGVEEHNGGQASRPFSTGLLNVSPRVHSRPIYLVVSKGPSGGRSPGEISS
jgi:hypothetical protein